MFPGSKGGSFCCFVMFLFFLMILDNLRLEKKAELKKWTRCYETAVSELKEKNRLEIEGINQ